MFKFLKSLKPAGKSKPPVALKVKTGKSASPKADSVSKPSAGSKPPDPLTPLSAAVPDQAEDGPSILDIMQERPLTPERAKLIENALSVHRARQDVFNELDESARQKLMLMSMLMLMKEARKQK
jgi:hypothetical protein